jgi:hypothetical protein
VAAGAFVAERSINEHEARKSLDRTSTANGAPTAIPENADVDAVEVNGPHLGVVARPSGMKEPSAGGGGEVAHDVAVWVEQANRRRQE